MGRTTGLRAPHFLPRYVFACLLVGTNLPGQQVPLRPALRPLEDPPAVPLPVPPSPALIDGATLYSSYES